MTWEKNKDLVLAVQPFRRGFAFVLMEAALAPVDWGIKEFRGHNWNGQALAAAKTLIERNHPDVLVIQDYIDSRPIRSHRVRRLQRLIALQAVREGVEVHRYTRANMHSCFARGGARTRYEIAQTIAAQIHAFSHQLPPARKLWDPENHKMYLFDAAALTWTFYASLDGGVAAAA